jgi:putative peptidoglycan lipid II flippase
MFLLPGAFALSAYTVVVRGYYAMQNTLFPAVFGTVAVSLSLPLYWYGTQWFEAQGIAFAVSLSGFFQVLLLYILWNRKTGNRESLRVYHFYIKIIVMSLLLGIFLEALKRKVFPFMDPPDLLRSAVVFLVIGGMYTLLIIGAGYLWKVQEINDVLARMIRRRPG